MDDPVNDITPIIHTLTQGTPNQQAAAINAYFTYDASFTHPFCQTGSFQGSRQLIHSIFQWYKIMSPKIDLQVHSVAFDQRNLILYVTISQTFAIWFLPFHHSHATLTTVLQLDKQEPASHTDDRSYSQALRQSPHYKYYIKSQNDLYQVSEFVKFFAPWGIGSTLVLVWHLFATMCCVVLAILGRPFTKYQQWLADTGKSSRSSASQSRTSRSGGSRAGRPNGLSSNGIQESPEHVTNKFEVLQSNKEA